MVRRSALVARNLFLGMSLLFNTTGNAQFFGTKKLVKKIENSFHSFTKQVKSFQACVFGKKECTAQETKVKYFLITAAALLIISTVSGTFGLREHFRGKSLIKRIDEAEERFNNLKNLAQEWDKQEIKVAAEQPIYDAYKAIKRRTFHRLKDDVRDIKEGDAPSQITLKSVIKKLNDIEKILSAAERIFKNG